MSWETFLEVTVRINYKLMVFILGFTVNPKSFGFESVKLEKIDKICGAKLREENVDMVRILYFCTIKLNVFG